MSGVGTIFHSGYISSLPTNKLNDANYDPWYILTSNNEIINFKDANNQQLHLNSLFIEAENTPLYININGYILYIPANESRNCDFESISSIQVMNLANTKLRWSGQYA